MVTVTIIIMYFLSAENSTHIISFSAYKPHHEIDIIILILQIGKLRSHKIGTSFSGTNMLYTVSIFSQSHSSC